MRCFVDSLKASMVLVLSSGVAVVCLQGIIYVSTQLSTVDAHGAQIQDLQQQIMKSNESVAQAFKDLEADRRVVREKMLQDLALIKAKLGIEK